MCRTYLYVVDRDFGFAPNPFHGVCTLATCKPGIRSTAKIGDWVFGLGGKTLKATGKCIYAMKITKKLTFNEYWQDPDFVDKKPVRNGSKKMMVGDNIYFQGPDGSWNQAQSHHSKPDGSPDQSNIDNDTKSKYMLVSSHFYYFGTSAPIIPHQLLDALPYKNRRGHSIFNYTVARGLIEWIESSFPDSLNLVYADPFNFDRSEAYYSAATNRVVY